MEQPKINLIEADYHAQLANLHQRVQELGGNIWHLDEMDSCLGVLYDLLTHEHNQEIYITHLEKRLSDVETLAQELHDTIHKPSLFTTLKHLMKKR